MEKFYERKLTMVEFEEYLSRIGNPLHRSRTEEVLNWVPIKFPGLKTKIAWNQPMFTYYDTFIIVFNIQDKAEYKAF